MPVSSSAPESGPTIVFVPGWWEGPAAFSKVSALLSARGFSVLVTHLPSTGTRSIPASSASNVSTITMRDDIASVHAQMAPLVEEEERDVVLVLHSAGGFIGSEAAEGLIRDERRKEGKLGGVIGIMALTAALWEEGHVNGAAPFGVYEDGFCHPQHARSLLYNDVPSDFLAERLLADLQPQPGVDWGCAVGYCAWKHVPSVYLLCKHDACVVPQWQQMFAALAKSRVVECNAGHMVQVTEPGTVIEAIIEAMEEWVN